MFCRITLNIVHQVNIVLQFLEPRSHTGSLPLDPTGGFRPKNLGPATVRKFLDPPPVNPSVVKSWVRLCSTCRWWRCFVADSVDCALPVRALLWEDVVQCASSGRSYVGLLRTVTYRTRFCVSVFSSQKAWYSSSPSGVIHPDDPACALFILKFR